MKNFESSTASIGDVKKDNYASEDTRDAMALLALNGTGKSFLAAEGNAEKTEQAVQKAENLAKELGYDDHDAAALAGQAHDVWSDKRAEVVSERSNNPIDMAAINKSVQANQNVNYTGNVHNL